MGRPSVVAAGGWRLVSALPARGEVWWRPVVVLSRDAPIPRLRRALVAPCTTTIRGWPARLFWNRVPTRSRAVPR